LLFSLINKTFSGIHFNKRLIAAGCEQPGQKTTTNSLPSTCEDAYRRKNEFFSSVATTYKKPTRQNKHVPTHWLKSRTNTFDWFTNDVLSPNRIWVRQILFKTRLIPDFTTSALKFQLKIKHWCKGALTPNIAQ